jgi:ABC-type sulfate transport system permease subunit
MNKTDCRTEKNYTRIMGIFVLFIGLMVALIGFIIVPVVGLIFALPVLILATLFIAAPESNACKLILKKI